MKNPSRRHLCSFCAADLAEIELLFVSDIGGLPPAICDRCVAYRHDIIVLRTGTRPALAEILIAEHNAIVERARRDARRA